MPERRITHVKASIRLTNSRKCHILTPLRKTTQVNPAAQVVQFTSRTFTPSRHPFLSSSLPPQVLVFMSRGPSTTLPNSPSLGHIVNDRDFSCSVEADFGEVTLHPPHDVTSCPVRQPLFAALPKQARVQAGSVSSCVSAADQKTCGKSRI